LVGLQALFHVVGQAGPDHVLGAQHVGVDALRGIVLGGRHLLQSGGMNDDVDTAQGQGQALAITDVAQEEAHLADGLLVELLAQLDLHVALLQFVAGVDDDLSRVIATQHGLDEPPAERAGAAGDQDHLAVQVEGFGRKTAQASASCDAHRPKGAATNLS
jgi:hypothetical protein